MPIHYAHEGVEMSHQEISGKTAIVTGASRGFGRSIAQALSKAGADVVGVARDRLGLEDLRADLGESFTPVAADAADPVAAGQLIEQFNPGVLILNAGAADRKSTRLNSSHLVI